jgi:hypothetical protein
MALVRATITDGDHLSLEWRRSAMVDALQCASLCRRPGGGSGNGRWRRVNGPSLKKEVIIRLRDVLGNGHPEPGRRTKQERTMG